MAEVRCSVCGVATPQTESCSFTLSPGAGDAGEIGPGTHVVCTSCSSRLSEEISNGRTTMLRPPDKTGSGADKPERDRKSSSRRISTIVSNPPQSSAISLDEMAMGSRPAPIRRNSTLVEFEFAKKRQFASYELLGEISRGSFGVVYKARQAGLDRIVALKVLLDGVHASPEAIERFNREAKSVARLKHPNVVPIYDIGASDGHHYFAMAFIEGYPLSTHILARTLTISDALNIAEQIADAVECAHRAGVIHRDIKPSNILIDKHGVPHITDFGLAKQVDLENKYTMSGTTLGTPAYMPPEQARGQLDKIDARSDVYALGTVLYEMLTGVTPFSGRSLLEVVVAVINEPVPQPRHLNPKIHRDIQTIVLKCLEKEREQRYTTAADLRDDLRRFRSGESILARPIGMILRMGRALKRNKAYAAAAVVLVCALGVAMKVMSDSKKKDLEVLIEKAKLQVKETELKEKEQVKYKIGYEWARNSRDPKLAQAQPPQADKREAVVYAPKEDGPTPGRKIGTIPHTATLVSPEEDRFFGDYKASMVITIDNAQTAAKGFTAGIQSANDNNRIPYVLEIGKGRAKLWAPSDLFVFTNPPDKRADRNLPLEVKIEKEAPTLIPGRYKLSIERLGTRLKFTLADDPVPPLVPFVGPAVGPARPAWGPVTIDIQDYNLSNFMMKYTQLVLREPLPGVELVYCKVEKKYGGQLGVEASAQTNFSLGEYNAAFADFNYILKENEKADRTAVKPEEWLNVARAHYQLGLIDEIWLSGKSPEDQIAKWPPIIDHYRKAKKILYELNASRNSPISAQVGELLREVRLRLVVCSARRNDDPNQRWRVVDEELTQGWMNGKVGEVLGWELLSVLDIARRDNRRDIGLYILMHCGLDAASSRVAAHAQRFGQDLVSAAKNESDERRRITHDQLRELYNAVPTPQLYGIFAQAAGNVLLKVPRDEAVKLLTYLPLDSTTGPHSGDLVTRTQEEISLLAEKGNWDLVQTLLSRYSAQPRVFASFLAALQEKNQKDLPVSFYSEVLAKVLPYMPDDPALRAALDKTAHGLSRFIVDGGRYADLMALHTALRQSRLFDARSLAQPFQEAVVALADKNDPDSEQLALNLLRYGSKNIQQSDAGLCEAAANLADRKAELDTESSFDFILKIKDACPSANLVPAARHALSKSCEAGKYQNVVENFIAARIKFLNDGMKLAPRVILALDNTLEHEKRDERLDKIWTTVRDELKRADDETALRQWQLEFGDILLALARRTSPVDYWEGARKNYREVLTASVLIATPTDAELFIGARAALRLMVLDLARRDEIDDPAMDAVMAPGAPEDIKLAAQALNSASPVKTRELKEKRDALAPEKRALTDPEWLLAVALRERLNGDEVKAAEELKEAVNLAAPSGERPPAAQGAPDRVGVPWVYTIGSELLRARRISENQPLKPDGEETAK